MADGIIPFEQGQSPGAEIRNLSDRITEAQLRMNEALRMSRDNARFSGLITDAQVQFRQRTQDAINQARNDGNYLDLSNTLREIGADISNNTLRGEASRAVVESFNNSFMMYVNQQILSTMSMAMQLQLTLDRAEVTRNVSRLTEESLVDAFSNQNIYEMQIRDIYNGASMAGTFPERQAALNLETAIEELRFSRADEAALVDPERALREISRFNLTARQEQRIRRKIANQMPKVRAARNSLTAAGQLKIMEALAALTRDATSARDIPESRIQELVTAIRGDTTDPSQLSEEQRRQLNSIAAIQLNQEKLTEFALLNPTQRQNFINGVQAGNEVAEIVRNGASPEERVAYQMINANLNAEINRDPYTLGIEQRQVANYTPLDLNDRSVVQNPMVYSGRIAEQLAERRENALRLSIMYGTPTPALTKQEIDQVKLAYENGGTGIKANLVQQLVEGLGTDSPDLFHFISGSESPTLRRIALLGGLQTQGEHGLVSDIIRGTSLRPRATNAASGPVAGGEITGGDTYRNRFIQMLETELPRLIPSYQNDQHREEIIEAAVDLSRLQTGNDLNALNRKAIRQSMRRITGELTRVNGSNVPLPPGMSESDFQGIFDVIDVETIDRLGGIGGLDRDNWVRQLRINAAPLAVGPGVYRFVARGNRPTSAGPLIPLPSGLIKTQDFTGLLTLDLTNPDLGPLLVAGARDARFRSALDFLFFEGAPTSRESRVNAERIIEQNRSEQ